MSYQCLHFDAKTAIARTSIAAWNALMRADPTFGRYALSESGRSAFLAAFTVVKDGEWRVGGKLHRVDGPARIYADGGEGWHEWCLRYQICRHAWIVDAREEWYEHGKLHRIGGPARIWPDGDDEWYEHGKLHRIGGPARTYADGTKLWYEYGKERRAPAR